jgi:hypothetical protein
MSQEVSYGVEYTSPKTGERVTEWGYTAAEARRVAEVKLASDREALNLRLGGTLFDAAVVQQPEAQPDLELLSAIGSVALVRVHTDAAKAWLEENSDVPGWAWLGATFGCEPRMVEHLLAGAEEDGLQVAR